MPTQPLKAREHQRQRRSEATVERILAAAEKLFLEKGFRAASLQDIASAAGHTTGAIYSSFRGKDDLFLALYRRKTKEHEDIWLTRLLAAANPGDAGQEIDSALTIRSVEPAWYAVVYEFLSYAARDERLSRETAAIRRQGDARMADALKEVAGSSPLSHDRLRQIVAALIRGLALTWFVDPESADGSVFFDAVAVLVGREPSSSTGRPATIPARPGVDDGRIPQVIDTLEEAEAQLPRTGRAYSVGFRREAIRVARFGDRSRRKVAEDLGISDGTLRKWLKQEDTTPSLTGDRGDSELQHVREEYESLRAEREILAKVVILLAKEEVGW